MSDSKRGSKQMRIDGREELEKSFTSNSPSTPTSSTSPRDAATVDGPTLPEILQTPDRAGTQ